MEDKTLEKVILPIDFSKISLRISNIKALVNLSLSIDESNNVKIVEK